MFGNMDLDAVVAILTGIETAVLVDAMDIVVAIAGVKVVAVIIILATVLATV